MSPGVDAGILELARAGHLSAVSCLTDGPTSGHNTPSLATLPVDIGLHLNFTESFRSGQFFLPLARLICACYARLLTPSVVATQIHSQLDAFETRFGCPPDFIDGHQHVHQLPIIREKLLEIIALRYPGQEIWLRSTQAALTPTLGRTYRQKAGVISLLGARKLRSLATARGLAMNHRLLGVYDFSASREQYLQLLMAWLAGAEDGDLLMCHPASSAGAGDPLGPQRTREFSVLSDSRFPAWLDKYGLTLSRLSTHRGAASDAVFRPQP